MLAALRLVAMVRRSGPEAIRFGYNYALAPRCYAARKLAIVREATPIKRKLLVPITAGMVTP